MRLKRIQIKNFRNIADLDEKLHPSTNLIVAPNATGKTNLLEAISMLSYGKSIKAKKQSQLFENGNKNKPIFIQGEVEIGKESSVFTFGSALENGRIKKVFKIDEDPIPYSQFVGRVITLFFTTSTIDLLSRSPSTRRRFLDRVIWLISPEYRKSLNRYEKALRQRNASLESKNKRVIIIWTKHLVDSGSKLIEERHKFFSELSKHIKMKFEASVGLSSVFEENAANRFASILKENLEQDLRQCSTSVGPHRDDWTILKKQKRGQDLRCYGSRGEQRMGILSMFIGILKVVEKEVGSPPVLLLDDLFSELDADNQSKLFEMVSDSSFQVIATTTPNTYKDIKKRFDKKCKYISLTSL